ncbi:hypothetical protein D3C81_1130530 [compost metagenome]
MGVGTDEGIRVDNRFPVHRLGSGHGSQILQVHLVNDPGSRRYGTEVVEGGLRPAQEAVTFLVALKLDLHVVLERIRGTKRVDHNGVVDNEINRHERVDLLRIAAGFLYGIAHGGEVNDNRHAGEILQNNTSRDKRNLLILIAAFAPTCDLLHMLLSNGSSVVLTYSGLKQHFNRERQLGNAAKPLLLESLQVEVTVALAADFQRTGRGEKIVR